jgi:hypothetical protein
MSDYMMGDPDNSVSVPFSDDEAAKDLEEDSPDASPEERITRKERRQARLRTLLSEGKQSKEELAALKAEQAATRAQLEQLRGYVAGVQQQQRPANDDGKDPYERRLDAVYDKQGEAYAAAQAEIAAGTFTAERQKYYERVAREVESEKTRIHTERVMESRSASQRAEQAQQVWVQKYPEVYGNRAAYDYAEGTWKRRKARGEAVTNEMVDEIMRETMTEFKLGKRAAPSANERSRMSGLPSAGGGGGGKPTSGGLTPELRRMAIAAHSDLPEAEAIKKWEKTTGARLRQKKVI